MFRRSMDGRKVRLAHTRMVGCLLLLISLIVPALASAATITYTGTLTTTDSTQTGRLFRNGTASTCAAPKPFPGTIGDNNARFYDAYSYTNTSATDECVTVTLKLQTAGCNVTTAAYLGNFDPANITANYLGDLGGSIVVVNIGYSYAFKLPPGQTAVVTAFSVDPGGVCAGYSLQLSTPDTTPPVITSKVVGTVGNNGWYTSDVNVSWSLEDDESPITNKTGCDPTTINSDTPGITLTCEATSAGGTSSNSVTIKRDATPPQLAPTISPNPVVLNGTATARPNASDAMSGLASAGCDPVSTSSVGAYTVACNATDQAGNTASANVAYTVGYTFKGFAQPVDNPGATNVLNNAKAGRVIPLKWRVLDANNAPVTSLESAAVKVTVENYNCGLSTTQDQVEERTSGSSGLQNLGNGYYQFNWQTPSTYANSCKTMKLSLSEGSIVHTALFKFTH